MTGGLAVLAAYVVGAIPVGYLIARAFGIADIRAHGSGNIGATNVLRTAGTLPAVLTLVGDLAKGAAAVSVAAAIAGDHPIATAAGALAAVVGNCWSVFLGFRGGKGVATALGALVRLVPWATLPAALVWLMIAATFRYASLASLTAVILIPLGALVLGMGWPRVVAPALIAALIVVRHRENIGRLVAGTERRIGERTSTA